MRLTKPSSQNTYLDSLTGMSRILIDDDPEAFGTSDLRKARLPPRDMPYPIFWKQCVKDVLVEMKTSKKYQHGKTIQ